MIVLSVFCLGFILGLVTAGLLGMLHKGQVQHDLMQSWREGYDAGQRVNQAKERLKMVPSRAAE